MLMSNAKGPGFPGRRIVGLGLVLAVGMSLAACGGGDDDDDASGTDSGSDSDYGNDTPTETDDDESGGGGGTAVAYEVSAIAFDDVSAPAGGTIEIDNTSGAPHTFTADDGSFDAPVDADASATVDVPADPGDYAFHCEIHSSMQATLSVE
jgi:plastocyanin